MKWDLKNLLFRDIENSFIICERLEDSLTVPQNNCHDLALQNNCHNKPYCCAVDENGSLWFGCSSHVVRKKCHEDGDEEMTWHCKEDGFFKTEFPITAECECKKCEEVYGNAKYTACLNKTAFGECPGQPEGYSKWYCNADGTFEGSPDISACCEEGLAMCRKLDPFLNLWISCPLVTTKKQTQCPENSVLETATAEWFCDDSGEFEGGQPNYDHCNDTPCSEGQCFATDKYGDKWYGCSGRTEERDCPSSFTGMAFWKCDQSLSFENSEPDFSFCKPEWIDQTLSQVSNLRPDIRQNSKGFKKFKPN